MALNNNGSSVMGISQKRLVRRLYFVIFVIIIFTINVQAQIELVWDNFYGGSSNDFGEHVERTSDDGYIIVGTTSSYGAGSTDIILIKTDASGVTSWQKTFGGANADGAYCVRQTPDNGYIIAGYSDSTGSGAADVWLIKTDSDGELSWSRSESVV